ncbi:MAG: RNA polymerase-binding protein DksA [Bradymonadales bacterium]|nr:MAG: RNA polymerase-binding protein DksA [Bradymonadales bacterium]
MANLTKKKLKDLEKSLRARLAELVAEVDEVAKNLETDAKERFADPTDQAVQELDRSRHLRFKERERKLIRKIETALRRMQEGGYGECVTCGAGIEVARLEARPMTDLCIDCATEAENEKRQMERYERPSAGAFSD